MACVNSTSRCAVEICFGNPFGKTKRATSKIGTAGWWWVPSGRLARHWSCCLNRPGALGCRRARQQPSGPGHSSRSATATWAGCRRARRSGAPACLPVRLKWHPSPTATCRVYSASTGIRSPHCSRTDMQCATAPTRLLSRSGCTQCASKIEVFPPVRI